MGNKNFYAILILGLLAFCCISVAVASTNIVSTPSSSRWAWNDAVSWIDFYITDTVNVTDDGLEGYASSSVGVVSLDCAHSPAGNICAGGIDYEVLNGLGGSLSGWAWNDAVGWISFCGGLSTANCPGSVSYRVLINPTTGDFSGWAWNDAVGWISFNCTDPGACGVFNEKAYKVQTSWTSTSTTAYLDSSTFDSGISGGAQINSVVWQGSMPQPRNNSFVAFQFAVSNSSGGPWNYQGPDGTANTYYTTYAENSPYLVNYVLHNNARYFRYRITLASTLDQAYSPRVDNVSVNWSR